jgi:hypothetical protein
VLQLRLDFTISDVTVPNDSANTDAINLHKSSKAQWLLYVLQGFSFSCLDSSTGPRPIYRLGFEVTLRHTTIGRTPLDEWSAPRRAPDLTTRTILKTDTHVPGGNRTRKPSMRVAADSRFWPRGHWYWLKTGLTFQTSMLCPQNIFVCYRCISEQTAIISVYSINRLVIKIVTERLLGGTKWILK